MGADAVCNPSQIPPLAACEPRHRMSQSFRRPVSEVVHHLPLSFSALFAFVGFTDLDMVSFGICNPVQQGKGAAFRVAESPHLCPALIVNAVNPAVVLLLGGHKDDYKKEPLHCALSPLLQFRV